MKKVLSTKQTTSKKRKIIENLIRDIRSGVLKRNEQIPNRKELARRFSVNPKTIDRAVGNLTERGILMTRQRQGTYVTPQALLDSEEIYGKYFSPSVGSRRQVRELSPYIAVGSAELNPFFFLQPCMKKISQVTQGLIQQPLDTWIGLSAIPNRLRDVLLKNVSMREGKYYGAENFKLLSGRLHTIRLIARLLLQPDDIVIMTRPSLLNETLFTDLGAEVWTVPQTNCGARATEVRRLSEKASLQGRHIALLYTNLQSDYGACEGEDRKQAMYDLLLLTAQLDMVLVEEFEDHEMMYEHVLTFADVAQEPMNHVVSIRSYSKLLVMYNELRVVLAAADFIALLKEWDDRDVEYGFLYEVLAARLLEANIFAGVTAPVTEYLRVQMRLLVEKCAKVLGTWVEVTPPASGTSFWIKARKDYEILVPVNKIRELNMLPRRSLVGPPVIKTKSLLLGFGNGATQELYQTIQIIAGEMHRHYHV
ncbi:GntR family transcriptional regulator [Olivibacter sp. CPCC 100613]|uniref:GntR family transcriptional regulator n=1 Tax=Olivibacter sp. CPCC 100613 TaxID=3079931 RepID=UPI002FFC5FDA